MVFGKMQRGWHSVWPWARLAGEEKQKENQKDNLGPMVDHNNHSCEPIIEY